MDTIVTPVTVITLDSTRIVHSIKADLVARYFPPVVRLVQYDMSLPVIAVSLMQNGQTYTLPSGAAANIRVHKPDATYVYNPALGCDSTRNIVYFEVTQAMAAANGDGLAIVEIVVDGDIAGTSLITLHFEENPVPEDAIESSDEWETIYELGERIIASTVTPVSTAAGMTDHNVVYLYTGTESGWNQGHMYYYNGTAWVDAGIAVTDTTLSVAGLAADAKKTGDEIADLKDGLTAVESDVTDLKEDLSALDVPVLTAKWVDGCLKSDGSVQAAAAYKTSQLIHIPAGFTLVFGSYASTSTYHFCNYEANGTFKSIGIGNTGLLGRQNIRIDAIEDRYVKICTNTSQISLSASNPHFERIKSEPTGLTDISNVGPASGVTFASGYLSSSSHSRTNSDVYYCSSVIFLQKGQTIEYRCSGSSGATLLMQTARGGAYIANLVVGNFDYHRLAYTNDTGDDIWVRICSRTAAGGNYVPLELFKDVKMYYKTLYHADEKLNGKKIVVIGDSLIYGNLLGNGVTWTAIMQNDTGAEVYNYGINGNAISSVSGASGTPMSVRYADIAELPTADIVVVEGGANDYNNACPIGTLADTQNNTFIGAVNVLIDGIRQLAPQAQILFMTTYNRTAAANSAGLHYADYANAMVNACANRSVPCYNNFAESGLALDNTNLTAWCDEGLYLGHSSVNRHFSPKAYDWLYPQYKHFIESRLA